MDYLDIDEVRHHILDRTVEDNDLDLDLSFSDEEIIKAMKRAARAFNTLPPQIMSVEWNRMPLDTNVFLDATAEHLYRAAIQKLRRNDIDYNAGGVATNLQAKRIANFERSIAELNKTWTDEAKATKVIYNMSQVWRVY